MDFSILVSVAILLSIFSGHSLTPLLFIFGGYSILKDKFKTNILYNLKNNGNALYLLLFLYAGVSIIWAPFPQKSLILLAQLLLIYFCYLWLSSAETSHGNYFLLYDSVIVALILYSIEIFSDGYILKAFKKYIFGQSDFFWHLHDLNRGLVLLGILTPYIYQILKHQKFLYPIFIVYSYVAFNSDSLCAKLVFVINIIMMFVFQNKQIYQLCIKPIRYMILFSLILVPIVCINLNPEKIERNYSNLGESTLHRIYIWNYVANSTYKNFPIFGNGFNSIRDAEMPKEKLHKQYGSLVPLHSHNHILQIWFELGLVGLFIYGLILNQLLKKASINYLCYIAVISTFVSQLVTYGIWQQWWISAFVISGLAYSANLKNKTKIH